MVLHPSPNHSLELRTTSHLYPKTGNHSVDSRHFRWKPPVTLCLGYHCHSPNLGSVELRARAVPFSVHLDRLASIQAHLYSVQTSFLSPTRPLPIYRVFTRTPILPLLVHWQCTGAPLSPRFRPYLWPNLFLLYLHRSTHRTC